MSEGFKSMPVAIAPSLAMAGEYATTTAISVTVAPASAFSLYNQALAD